MNISIFMEQLFVKYDRVKILKCLINIDSDGLGMESITPNLLLIIDPNIPIDKFKIVESQLENILNKCSNTIFIYNPLGPKNVYKIDNINVHNTKSEPINIYTFIKTGPNHILILTYNDINISDIFPSGVGNTCVIDIMNFNPNLDSINFLKIVNANNGNFYFFNNFFRTEHFFTDFSNVFFSIKAYDLKLNITAHKGTRIVNPYHDSKEIIPFKNYCLYMSSFSFRKPILLDLSINKFESEFDQNLLDLELSYTCKNNSYKISENVNVYRRSKIKLQHVPYLLEQQVYKNNFINILYEFCDKDTFSINILDDLESKMILQDDYTFYLKDMIYNCKDLFSSKSPEIKNILYVYISNLTN